MHHRKPKNNCNHFKRCSSPFCPMDELNNLPADEDPRIWYPIDEICANRQLNKAILYYQQKKIKKRSRSLDTYYTREMLERDCIVKSAMEGLDPDKGRKEQLAQWKSKHKKISQKQRSVNKMRGKALGNTRVQKIKDDAEW